MGWVGSCLSREERRHKGVRAGRHYLGKGWIRQKRRRDSLPVWVWTIQKSVTLSHSQLTFLAVMALRRHDIITRIVHPLPRVCPVDETGCPLLAVWSIYVSLIAHLSRKLHLKASYISAKYKESSKGRWWEESSRRCECAWKDTLVDMRYVTYPKSLPYILCLLLVGAHFITLVSNFTPG